jgi:hypothetical protein
MARMGLKRDRPAVLHRCCTWPGCTRDAEVCVEYEQTREHALRLAWVPAVRGIVNLCGAHAAEMPAALGAGRVVGMSRS